MNTRDSSECPHDGDRINAIHLHQSVTVRRIHLSSSLLCLSQNPLTRTYPHPRPPTLRPAQTRPIEKRTYIFKSLPLSDQQVIQAKMSVPRFGVQLINRSAPQSSRRLPVYLEATTSCSGWLDDSACLSYIQDHLRPAV